MTNTDTPIGATRTARPRAGADNGRIRLGFHTRIPFATGHVAEGLRDGIELFRVAEQLGFDTGWTYQRHFDNYLASPLVFLPVVGQRTSRIGLGTAIIPMRYEDPVLLAEGASIADHLVDGRLQLGLGTGIGGFDAQFGQEPNDGRQQSQERLATFLRGIRGESLGESTNPDGTATGQDLTIRGTSDGLPGRTWFGGGSVNSAERIGRQGLRLLLSTILTTTVEDYNAEQAEAIRAYRRVYAGTEPSRVAVSRSILPATTPELARLYADYDAERRALGPGAARPLGALAPVRRGPARSSTVSTSIHGSPAAVVDALLADVGVAGADELIAFIPPSFALPQTLKLLEDIVETVAPQLGWVAPPS